MYKGCRTEVDLWSSGHKSDLWVSACAVCCKHVRRKEDICCWGGETTVLQGTGAGVAGLGGLTGGWWGSDRA